MRVRLLSHNIHIGASNSSNAIQHELPTTNKMKKINNFLETEKRIRINRRMYSTVSLIICCYCCWDGDLFLFSGIGFCCLFDAIGKEFRVKSQEIEIEGHSGYKYDRRKVKWPQVQEVQSQMERYYSLWVQVNIDQQSIEDILWLNYILWFAWFFFCFFFLKKRKKKFCEIDAHGSVILLSIRLLVAIGSEIVRYYRTIFAKMWKSYRHKYT